MPLYPFYGQKACTGKGYMAAFKKSFNFLLTFYLKAKIMNKLEYLKIIRTAYKVVIIQQRQLK